MIYQSFLVRLQESESKFFLLKLNARPKQAMKQEILAVITRILQCNSIHLTSPALLMSNDQVSYSEKTPMDATLEE